MLCLSSRCTGCANRRRLQRRSAGGGRITVMGAVHFAHLLNDHLGVLVLAAGTAPAVGLLLKAGDGLEPSHIIECCALLREWHTSGALRTAHAELVCVHSAAQGAGVGDGGVLLACTVRVWLCGEGGERSEEHGWGSCCKGDGSGEGGSVGTVAAEGTGDVDGLALAALSVASAAVSPPPPGAAALHAMLDTSIVSVAPRCGQSGQPRQRQKQLRKSRSKANGNRIGRFADWLCREFGHELLDSPQDAHVLDVAGGGQSGLAWELCVRRGVSCTVVDPRPVKLDGRRAAAVARRAQSAEALRIAWLGHQGGRGDMAEDELLWPLSLQRVFDALRCGGRCEPRQICTLFGVAECRDNDALRQAVRGCSLVVGFHPDEATDAIVDVAIAEGKPFAVVPCCVFWRRFGKRRVLAGVGAEPPSAAMLAQANSEGFVPVRTHEQLCAYLLAKAPGARELVLDFEGRNKVVYWRPDSD